MKTVLLYTTLGCHLCEQAEAIAAPILTAQGFALKHVEISDSDALLERYGVRIPVLRVEGAIKELAWPFDESGVGQLIDVKTNITMK